MRQAANVGAARRDGDGQLFVHFRTWLLLHDGLSPRTSRNLEVRAQLVVQLQERVRNLWRDFVGTYDAIRVTIVTPTPAREGDDETRIHVLVERNRLIASTLRPILMSFQQITMEGLNAVIDWHPLLAPPVITLSYLQRTCQIPCELHHLLVPLAPTHRGWMESHQQRHVVPGNFIPAWWDMRRRPPAAPEGTDENSHLQLPVVQACGTLSYPHVSDRWCDNTVSHTPEQLLDTWTWECVTYFWFTKKNGFTNTVLVLPKKKAKNSINICRIFSTFFVYFLIANVIFSKISLSNMSCLCMFVSRYKSF